MGKYDPLSLFLRRQRQAKVRLTFADIERIVGRLLPKAARQTHWWTGTGEDGSTAPQRSAWIAANYAAVPDVKAESVLFERMD